MVYSEYRLNMHIKHLYNLLFTIYFTNVMWFFRTASDRKPGNKATTYY